MWGEGGAGLRSSHYFFYYFFTLSYPLDGINIILYKLERNLEILFSNRNFLFSFIVVDSIFLIFIGYNRQLHNLNPDVVSKKVVSDCTCHQFHPLTSATESVHDITLFGKKNPEKIVV